MVHFTEFSLNLVAIVLCTLIVGYLFNMNTKHNCIKQFSDPPPTPCVVVTADAEPEDIANRFNLYYARGMTVHYLHGTDNGDMIACFVAGHADEAKRFNK